MRKPNQLPSAEYLRECFEIQDDWGLVWAKRPRHHFANASLWKTQNSRDAGCIAGGADERGYLRVRLDGKLYAHHRVIWKMVNGTEPPDIIDHQDRFKANNDPKNLREATQYLNCINRSTRSDNISGLKGVGYMSGRWRARIQVEGKPIYLGSFDVPEKAAAACIAARIEHFGADGIDPEHRHDFEALVMQLAKEDVRAGSREIPGFTVIEERKAI